MASNYITARSMGKIRKCHLKGATGRKWANGLKIYDSDKKVEGIGRPPDWDNNHVYYHDIQRSSLKLLGK